jgi:hypothetical protein
MSDFRSLLSSFQDATSPSATSINPPTSSTSSTTKIIEKSNGRNTKKDEPTYNKGGLTPLVATYEDIDKLWRTSQIQSSFHAIASHQHESIKKISSPEGKNNGGNANMNEPIHLAICATICTEFPHEDIWRKWSSHEFNDSSNTRISASIHVHAKTPSAIPANSWLKSRLIPISHNPNWNDYRIILAMLSLAEHAIKDEPKTTHIMMVTESCIPIATMEEIATIILKEGLQRSFLDAYDINSPRCTRFDEHKCFSISSIPKDAIYKALPGWTLFSKLDMVSILNLKQRLNGRELYPLFKTSWAPEEIYFSTVLALLGKMNNPNGVVRKSLMWSKWDAHSKGADRAHPIVYDGQFSSSLIDDVRKKGFVFMRKWKKRIDVHLWEAVVLTSATKLTISGGLTSKRKSQLSHLDSTSAERKRKRK